MRHIAHQLRGNSERWSVAKRLNNTSGHRLYPSISIIILPNCLQYSLQYGQNECTSYHINCLLAWYLYQMVTQNMLPSWNRQEGFSDAKSLYKYALISELPQQTILSNVYCYHLFIKSTIVLSVFHLEDKLKTIFILLFFPVLL